MSFLVVLDSKATAGLGVSTLDIGCRSFEYCAAIAFYFPDCVALLIPSHEFEEGESVHLLPGKVFEVSCMCHIRIEIIDQTPVLFPRC